MKKPPSGGFFAFRLDRCANNERPAVRGLRQ